jgi:uncharacterized protein
MKELLEYIVKSIVNNPDSVDVEEKESVDFPGLIILTIDVAEEDKGIVIGRRGRTINAIRDLITINAIRNDKRVKVLIKDDRPKRTEDTQEENTQDTSEDMLIDDEI